jgi:hypothetical protein
MTVISRLKVRKNGNHRRCHPKEAKTCCFGTLRRSQQSQKESQSLVRRSNSFAQKHPAAVVRPPLKAVPQLHVSCTGQQSHQKSRRSQRVNCCFKPSKPMQWAVQSESISLHSVEKRRKFTFITSIISALTADRKSLKGRVEMCESMRSCEGNGFVVNFLQCLASCE